MDVNKGLCLLQIADRDATIAARDATISDQDATISAQHAALSAQHSALTQAQTIIRYHERKIQAVNMPRDRKRREVLILFHRHKGNEKLIVVMRRQRAYVGQRRKELEASGFVAGEAVCDVPNSRYSWMDFQRQLQKSGALVRCTTPNLLKRGSNINSLLVTCHFDVQMTLDALGCSKEEGDWLRAFLPFGKPPREQRTMDEFLRPRSQGQSEDEEVK